MTPSAIDQYPYLFISLISFLVNVPLGYWRENTPKFSAKWFLWIHASIPLIVYLRMTLGTSAGFIPTCLFLALSGQAVGSLIRRREMTAGDREKLQQISDLKLNRWNSPGQVPDREVMVVLLNMGGPKTNADVPGFLKRVFNDSCIIRFPLSKIFQSLFASMLTAARSKATQERYQLIGGGSPIFDSTSRQMSALKSELHRRGRALDVTFSFNYSSPLPAETIEEIKQAGKKYLLPLSLYPHYSSATTGSSLHYLKNEADQKFPELTFLPLPVYSRHDGYLNAFVERIHEQLKPGETLDEFFLLFSAHGLPMYFLTEGDAYPFQIAETAGGVLQRLNRTRDWTVCYQSDVGPLQWLKPSTENTLLALARRGIKKLLVVPISFVTDHIETLCEIDIEYRKTAEDAGIADFRMSKALECHPGFITALADAVEEILPPQSFASRPAANLFNVQGKN